MQCWMFDLRGREYLQELGRMRKVEHGLNLVDEPGVVPTAGGDRVITPAWNDNFAW